MTSTWIARHGMDSAHYQAEFDRLVTAGYRLLEINGYAVSGHAYYSAIWEQSAGPAWIAPWTQRSGVSSGVRHGGQAGLPTHARQWLWRTGGCALRRNLEQAVGAGMAGAHGLTAAQYQAEFDELVRAGYRLEHVSSYSVDDQAHYAAIWRNGPAQRGRRTTA